MHMQKVKVKDDHSVQKLEWEETDGRTDGGDCIQPPVLTRSVKI